MPNWFWLELQDFFNVMCEVHCHSINPYPFAQIDQPCWQIAWSSFQGKRHSLGVTTWSKMCKTPFVVGTSCLGTFEATNSAAQHHPFLGLKCFLRLNGFFCMHCKQSSTKLTKLSLLPLRSLSSSALAVWNWTCKSLQNSKLDQKKHDDAPCDGPCDISAVPPVLNTGHRLVKG